MGVGLDAMVGYLRGERGFFLSPPKKKPALGFEGGHML